MLESVKISRRQSEIRQALAGLVGKPQPSEDETRQMETLDGEYRSNETRFRAALIAEDTERRSAGNELETRGEREFADLVNKFELRQVCLFLDEGKALDGATAEIVSELRSQGGYQGCPIPWLALERRTGETIASGVPSPKSVAPIIDRLFPDSVAAKMGASLINIGQGTNEYPITSSSVTAGWAATETGAVAGPTVFSTAQRSLAPSSTLGIQLKVTRKSLKQSGDALEQAIRRDINGTIASVLDKSVFLGAGSSGEPLGVIPGQSTYSYTTTAVGAAATWSAFRAAVVAFMTGNAANSPDSVRLLLRPEVWSKLDNTLISGTGISEWDRLLKNIPAGNVVLTSNALAAPTGSPAASTAVLATNAGGVAPVYVGLWGGVDLIRDVYSDAASGGLRLTALVTADVTVSRAAQVQTLTGVQS